MKPAFYIVFLLLAISLLTECDKKFDVRDFPSVLTVSAVNAGTDGIIFSGELIARNAPGIKEVGFVWQNGKDPVDGNGFIVKARTPSGSGSFEASVSSSLEKDKSYFLRAYVVSGDKKVYGEKVEFKCASEFPVALVSFEPAIAHSGDTLTIKGGHFCRDIRLNEVKFDTLKSEITELNDSVIKCIVPLSLELKSSTIKVITNGLQASFYDKFSLVTPVITSFAPQQVYLGDNVKITGTGFHKIQSYNKVRLGLLNVNIVSSTETEINFKVPNSLDTLCYIYVTVSGQRAMSSNKLAISLPRLNTFAPTSGRLLDTIILNVANLRPEKSISVYFDNIQARIINRNGSYLRVEVPGTLSKEYSIVKAIIDGESFSFSTEFRLVETIITGISTNIIKPGKNLTIFGKNFSQVTGGLKVIFKSSNKTYILTPFFISPDSVKVEITNQGNPGQPLDLASYQVGIQTNGKTIFSVFYLTITGSWTKLTDFPGGERYKATAFTINGKGYFGLGSKSFGAVQKDLWEYTPSTDRWIQVSDFPGLPRIYPFTFLNSGSAFIGGGQSTDNSSTQVPYSDFYKFTPSSNSWSRILDAPSVEKSFFGACISTADHRHFAIMVRGSLNEYNETNNTWSQDYSGEATKASNTGVFYLNNKIYFVGGGKFVSGITYASSNEVWEYNPASNTMNRKNDFPGISRYAGIYFTIGGYGYYGCGEYYITNVALQFLTDMYRYNPSDDSWTKIDSFPGGGTLCPSMFVINNKAYVIGGYNDSFIKNEVWVFNPD